AHRLRPTGVFADDGDGPDALRIEGEQVALVLEQYDGLTSNLASQDAVFWPVDGLFGLQIGAVEGAHALQRAQEPAYFVVNERFVQLAPAHHLGDLRAVVARRPGHL